MKPLVILAGPIHADGVKQLESEARVIVSNEETEAGMIKIAQEASGILFRAKPLCSRSLMAACTPTRTTFTRCCEWPSKAAWTARMSTVSWMLLISPFICAPSERPM